MVGFKGSHFEQEMILWDVRWYVAYPSSSQQLKAKMRKRGFGGSLPAQSLGHQIRGAAFLSKTETLGRKPSGSEFVSPWFSESSIGVIRQPDDLLESS
jgi:hypothetical protein